MKEELRNIRISDYSYDLPVDKIAKFPLPKRDQSKLLVYQKGRIWHQQFQDISKLIPPNSSLILNNTRVIEARMLFQKQTGAVIEIFCLEPHLQSIEQSLQQKEKAQWQCLIGGASKWKHGQVLEKRIRNNDQYVTLKARFIEKTFDSFIIELSWEPQELNFAELLHLTGAVPLPPS